MEWVQQKIFSGRSSQSWPLKLADAEQPFCTLTEECITPKGLPNQAALWTPNKNSFNENFIPGQTMGHVIVCLKLCILLGKIHGALLVLESLWRSHCYLALETKHLSRKQLLTWNCPSSRWLKRKCSHVMWGRRATTGLCIFTPVQRGTEPPQAPCAADGKVR